MTRRRLSAACSLLLSLALPAALHAQTTPSTSTPSDAKAGAGSETYTIDPVHSMALFRVQHLGAGVFWGRFNTVTGTIVYAEGENPPMVLNVAIEINSVDVGDPRLDGHIKSPDFFHAEDFPQATFTSTSARKVGDRRYEVIGDLTMRGVTKTITVPVEWVGTAESRGGKRCGFETVFTVDRHDYGISYGPRAIGTEVRLTIAMEGLLGGRPQAEAAGERGTLPARMAAMDANGDGKLQKDEMPEFMQTRFEQLDTNGDGAVDGDEIRAMRKSRRE